MGSSSSSAVGEEYISHYGVRGMKWGVRRSRAVLAKAREKRNSEGARITAERKALKKKVRTLSDGDIQKFTQRLEAERKLSTLLKDDTAPGKKKTVEILDSVGTKTVKTVGTASAVAVAAHFARKGLKAKGLEADFKLPKLK